MTIQVRGMAPLLQVFDMPASLRFYTEVLGFEVIRTAGPAGDTGWAWLSLQGTELMLNTQYELPERPAAPDPARQSAHADTMLFFAAPDPATVAAQLRAAGRRVEYTERTGYGFRAATTTDPDGYQLVFHWPATDEAAAEWRSRYGFDPLAKPASEATP